MEKSEILIHFQEEIKIQATLKLLEKTDHCFDCIPHAVSVLTNFHPLFKYFSNL